MISMASRNAFLGLIAASNSAPAPSPPKPAPALPAETPAPVDAGEAAAVPALRDTIAALKAALDAEQARNRDLRRARDAGGPLYRVWRWMQKTG
jgi:hypothetical protein